jgi:hypothetical protein
MSVFNVDVRAPWRDTGIDVVAGQSLEMSTDPNATVSFGWWRVNADGVGLPFVDGTVTGGTILPDTIILSLVGKIGGTTAVGTGTPLPEGRPGKGPGFVGSSYHEEANVTGRLFLGFNDDIFGDNSGSFSVTINVGGPDLAPTSLTWDTTQGGANFAYKVTGATLPQDTTAMLYWASGTTTDTILEPATTPIPIPHTTPLDQIQTVHLAPADFPGGPAPGAKYLLAVVDPDNMIDEGVQGEKNNELPLATPLAIAVDAAADGSATYHISSEPRMPELQAHVLVAGVSPGAIQATAFTWTTQVYYHAPAGSHGKDLPDSRFTEMITGSDYKPQFPRIRGGNLTLSVTAQVAGITFTATQDSVAGEPLMIVGDNPTPQQVSAYVDTIPVPKEWPNQYKSSYHTIIRKIISAETRDNDAGIGQFLRNGQPFWSTYDRPDAHGAGLMQLSESSADQVWNWKVNIAGGVAWFNHRLRYAKAYFDSLVAALGVEVQDPEQQYGVKHIVIPPVTADMIVEDAIRGYNGYTFSSNPLHEWRPLRDPQTGLLILKKHGQLGEVQWERTPASLRYKDGVPIGDPDYVIVVLGRSDF